MEILTYQELIKNIIENQYGDIDFYAYCNTPWHSLGIQTFINNELSIHKKIVKGIVFIANAPGKSNIVSPEDFIFNDNVRAIFIKNKDSREHNKIKHHFSIIVSRKRKLNVIDEPFFMLRPFTIDYKFGAEYQAKTGRKCQLVAIDEGIGAYKSKKEIFAEKLSGEMKIKSALGYVYDSLVDFILKYKFNLQVNRYLLFKNQGQKLVPNEIIINLYRQTIQRIAQRSRNYIDDGMPSKYVILLTEPYDLEYQKPVKSSINAIYNQMKIEWNKQGIKVFIKPHPREDMVEIDEYKKSGFEILSGQIPIETYIEILPIPPMAVLGTLGTALVTVSAINKIPSYSIVPLIEDDKVNKEYKKAVENYKIRYSDLVCFPKNMEELTENLEMNFIS